MRMRIRIGWLMLRSRLQCRGILGRLVGGFACVAGIEIATRSSTLASYRYGTQTVPTTSNHHLRVRKSTLLVHVIVRGYTHPLSASGWYMRGSCWVSCGLGDWLGESLGS
jgi:hypothetical protein